MEWGAAPDGLEPPRSVDEVRGDDFFREADDQIDQNYDDDADD